MGKTTTDWIINAEQAESSLAGLIADVEKYNNTIGKSADASKQAFQKSAAATANFNKELANNSRQYRLIQDEARKISPLFAQAVKAQKQFTDTKGLKETEKQIAKVKAKISETKKEIEETTKSGGFLKNMFGGIGSSIASFFAVGTIVSFGKAVFDATAQNEAMAVSLAVMLKSKEQADILMGQLAKFAATTPFELTEIQEATKKLLAFGLTASEIEPTLRALGDVSSGIGAPIAEIAELYGKAKVQGRLFAEDVNQLTGRGIPIIQELAKQFKVTDGEVKKLVESGKVGFPQLETAFKNMTSEGGQFYNLMQAQSETLAGSTSNLMDNFNRLFVTLGKGNSGVLKSAVKGISDYVEGLTKSFMTVDDIAQEQAGKGISEYTDRIKKQLTETAISAEKSGKDITKELTAIASAEEQRLQTMLKGAERNLLKYQNFLENRSIVEKVAKPRGLDPGLVETENTYLARVKEIQGQAAALKPLVAEVTKARLKLADEADAELKKAAAERNKKAAAERKKALAEYSKELEDLEKQAAKARLEMMNKNTVEYYDAVLASDLAGIDKVRTELIKASKAAGKGGKLGSVQQEQLEILETQAMQNHFEGISKIQEAHDDKMLDLQKENDQKQIDQINRRYDKEIKAANKAKDFVLAAQLEKARGLEVSEASLQQALKKNQSAEELAVSKIEGGKFVTDSLNPVKIEKAKQQAILDVQIEFAKKRLALLEAAGGEENQVAIQNLKNLVDKLKTDKEKDPIRGKFDLLKMMGVEEEDREKATAAFAELGAMAKQFATDYIAQQLQIANQVVEQKDRAIDDKRDELNQEIELNKQGFASNVEGKRAELAELKRQREEALKEQQKAQKLQNAIDTANQIQSLITAGAKIFEVTSYLNIAPGLGIAIAGGLIAAMFAAMTSMRSKAASVTKAERGLDCVGGKRHSQGGNKYRSMDDHNDILEIEEGERIVNRKSNQKYWEFLNAINSDDEARFASLAFDQLIKGTGVVPAKNLPKKVRQLAEKSIELNRGNNSDFAKKLTSMENELKQIRKNTGKEERIETATQTIIKSGSYTKITNKKHPG